MELNGAIILITGSSTGIGKATALAFAKEGVNLIITYHSNEAEGREVEQACRQAGAKKVILLQLDVTNNESITQLVNQTVQTFGEISVLINNAGTIEWKYLEEQRLEEIERQVRVNLEGLIKMTKISLPHISEMIINIASTAGIRAHKDLTTYCATKWGVRGFTKALTDEVNHLRIYAVNPGPTATAMTDYEGIDPAYVAEIIVNLTKGKIEANSGDDIIISDYLPHNIARNI